MVHWLDVCYWERGWGCMSVGKFFNSCISMDGQIFLVRGFVFGWFIKWFICLFI